MKVRMKVGVSGSRNGQVWPPIGETMDLPDHEGAELCAANMAEPVKSDTTERAVPRRPVETRDEPAQDPEPASESEAQQTAVTTETGPSRRRGRQ